MLPLRAQIYPQKSYSKTFWSGFGAGRRRGWLTTLDGSSKSSQPLGCSGVGLHHPPCIPSFSASPFNWRSAERGGLTTLDGSFKSSQPLGCSGVGLHHPPCIPSFSASPFNYALNGTNLGTECFMDSTCLCSLIASILPPQKNALKYASLKQVFYWFGFFGV